MSEALNDIKVRDKNRMKLERGLYSANQKWGFGRIAAKNFVHCSAFKAN